jgi:predicted metalloprotease with PDZ domain
MIGWLPLLAALAQQPDTLIYNVQIVPRDWHLTVEARLSHVRAGTLQLAHPPQAGPAGTSVSGLSVTDATGRPLTVERNGESHVVTVPADGPVRFRYRLDVHRRLAQGSTGTGLDSTRLYAVTRSIFVAPDPTSYLKTGDRYPALAVVIIPPRGWEVAAGWPRSGTTYVPAGGDELLGTTIAAAPDLRLHAGQAGNATWQLAVRGRRYFSDSLLQSIIDGSLELGAATLGDIPVSLVTYTGDVGPKGSTSGSLQGKASIGLVWEPSEVLEQPRGHDVFHETMHLWFGGAMDAPRWWTEGITDYYAARLYAQWSGEQADMARLIYRSLRHYQAIGHRSRLTMSQETRQGMAGDNTALLVYRKGMLAGLLFDAAIRRASGGRRSLDDVARGLLARAAARSWHSVSEREIRDALIEAGGAPLRQEWQRLVESTGVISDGEIETALRVVTGRQFEPPPIVPKARKRLAR